MTCGIQMWTFLLVGFSFLQSIVSAGPACPAKCRCVATYLHCVEGGHTQIPKSIPMLTNQISFINNDFSQKPLEPADFSNWDYPTMSILQLAITKCQVRKITPGTFSRMTKLNKLLLSENIIDDLYADSFKGLNLKMLMLDNNPNIRLHANCFRGLEVTSLSIKKCRLTTLAYETIKPIATQLQTFLLADNQLKTFSPRFDSIFRNVQTLNIEGNPLDCNCTLLWLSKVISWKKQYGTKTSFDSTEQYPKCATPPALMGRFIHSIPEEKLRCAPPRLSAIELNVLSSKEAELTCQPDGGGISRVLYRRFDTTTNRWMDPGVSFTLSNEMRKQTPYKIARTRFVVRELVSCQVQDSHGKNGPIANVSINWMPEKEVKKIPTPPSSYKPPIKVDLSPDETDTSSKVKEGKDYSEKANGDQKGPPNKKFREHILYQKKFTLLEMIGAVVGTFTITLAIFLCIYRCFIHGRKRERKKAPYSAYGSPPYDPSTMMFGQPDTQTYDIPQLPSYPPPPPPSREQFLDYKTQRAVYNRV